MTDRMHDDHLDREIRRFLAWQAEDVGGAPTAAEIAIRVSSRSGAVAAGRRVAPRLVWVLLAALIVALLGAAAFIGANPQRSEPLRSLAYEAVFLRLEVAGSSRQVLVVGVDPAGRERGIASLPDAWVT